MKTHIIIQILSLCTVCNCALLNQIPGQLSESAFPKCLRGDCINGIGVQQRSEFEVYSGGFHKGLYHGKGSVRCLKEANQNEPATLHGEFSSGEINGAFEMITDKFTASGTFLRDNYEGKLRLASRDKTRPDIQEWTYEKGMRHGPAQMTRGIGKFTVALQMTYNRGQLESMSAFDAQGKPLPLRFNIIQGANGVICEMVDLTGKAQRSEKIACEEKEFPKITGRNYCNGT